MDAESVHVLLLFFFSSRRRHTRFDCDWSSDVCSSDLASSAILGAGGIWKAGHRGGRREDSWSCWPVAICRAARRARSNVVQIPHGGCRSEEHTSELQSQSKIACRLLLAKKKKKRDTSS